MINGISCKQEAPVGPGICIIGNVQRYRVLVCGSVSATDSAVVLSWTIDVSGLKICLAACYFGTIAAYNMSKRFSVKLSLHLCISVEMNLVKNSIYI